MPSVICKTFTIFKLHLRNLSICVPSAILIFAINNPNRPIPRHIIQSHRIPQRRRPATRRPAQKRTQHFYVQGPAGTLSLSPCWPHKGQPHQSNYSWYGIYSDSRQAHQRWHYGRKKKQTVSSGDRGRIQLHWADMVPGHQLDREIPQDWRNLPCIWPR